MYSAMGLSLIGLSSFLAPPLAPFIIGGAIAAAVPLGLQGIEEINQSDQENAVRQLRSYIQEVLGSVRRALTEYDVRKGDSLSAVDNWIQQIRQSFAQSLENMYQLESQRQQQELESIERMHQLESDKFNQKKADLQDQSQQWAKLEQFQKQAAELLKKLEAELERPQVA